MGYLNPNKYVRAGIISALQTATGLSIWNQRVPISITVPKQYILLDSQTKNEYAKGKQCFEWMLTIDVAIYNHNTYGNSGMSAVDDIEQKVISALKDGFSVANFYVKNVDILESIELSFDMADKSASVDRRIIKFDIWVNGVNT